MTDCSSWYYISTVHSNTLFLTLHQLPANLLSTPIIEIENLGDTLGLEAYFEVKPRVNQPYLPINMFRRLVFHAHYLDSAQTSPDVLRNGHVRDHYQRCEFVAAFLQIKFSLSTALITLLFGLMQSWVCSAITRVHLPCVFAFLLP